MGKRHLYLLTFALTAVGLVIFLVKLVGFGFPLLPGKDIDVWRAEAKVTFVAKNKPVKVSVFIPRTSPRFTLRAENFVSRGFGLLTAREGDNRVARWSIRNASGKQTLYYRTVIGTPQPRKMDLKDKRPDIPPPEFEGPYLLAAQEVLSGARERSDDIETLVLELLKQLNSEKPDENMSLLLGHGPSKAMELELAVRLLALEGIPARMVNGIKLVSLQRDAPVRRWLEVYDKDRWRSFDPVNVQPEVPSDYFPWWHGTESFGKVKGGEKLKITVSVDSSKEAALHAALERGRASAPFFFEFSLFRLPVDTQAVYHILLLIPLGAFLLVVFRNVIGIKTFGTFMPVLIALAFRETNLLWGLVLFSGIVALGLSIRIYLEGLKLLLVPRLAAILIVVTLLLAFISVMSHNLGIERGLSVALFPMVILTMTIERMSIVWEERGRSEALQQGAGSLLVATVAYMVMVNRFIENLVFVFPELLLLLLAATLLLGRYSGYRLVELFRFKSMVQPPQ